MTEELLHHTRQLEATAALRSRFWDDCDSGILGVGPPVHAPGRYEQDIAALWAALAASLCIIQQLIEDRNGRTQETEACPRGQNSGLAPGTSA